VALSDAKKVQTMINITAKNIIAVRAAIESMKDVRTVFTTIDPDVTGTPLEGNVDAVNTALNNLDTLVNSTNAAVWDGMIAAHIDSHREESL